MCEGCAHVGSGVTRPRGDRVDSLMTRIRCQVGAAGDRNDVAGVNSCAVPCGMLRMNLRSKIIMIASASSAGGVLKRPDRPHAGMEVGTKVVRYASCGLRTLRNRLDWTE